MIPDSPATAESPERARRVDADSPWLGLLPFTEETQRFFFGREAEIREIFLRVRDQTLTVLYGQSGYGKTSLLNAGLIPKLRADGFRPVLLRLRFEKDDPPALEQLRTALANECANETTPAEEWLTRWGTATLWECFHHSPLRPDRLAAAPLVILFDQFEEIFTLGTAQRPRPEIEALATELADLVENRPPASVRARLASDLEFADELDFGQSPLRLIITLREDFLSHLETWKGAMPSLMRNRMALQLLRGTQAWEAVVRPGRLDGQNLISDEVGAQIVRVIARRATDTPLEEIEAVPPLLSLLCDELNRARAGAPAITAELVEQRHGDILHEFYSRCFKGFPPAVRRFVEDRLVTVGGHRNLVAREDAEAELARADVPEPADVLDKLLARRLLSAEERGGTQRIEITHDVLAPLVTESRDKRKGRERAEQAEAEQRIAQEKAERAALEKRKLQRFAIGAAIAALLAIAAMSAGIFGMWQAKEANHTANKLLDEAARSDELVAEEKLSTGDIGAAFAHLARAITYKPNSTDAVVKVVAALNDWRFQTPELIFQGHSPRFSSDGHRVLTIDGKTARLWDASSGKLLVTLSGHEGTIRDAEFSPDGKWVVTASADTTARLWEAGSGKGSSILRGHPDAVLTAEFSADGRRILTTSADNTARVWDSSGGQLLTTIQSENRDKKLVSASFSPDGQRIVTANQMDKTVSIWDVGTGALLRAFEGTQDFIYGRAFFSHDGQLILTLAGDHAAQLWNAKDGRLLVTLGHEAQVFQARFNPDETKIVTASGDQTASVWDSASGKLLVTLKGHQGSVFDARFSPDGQRIVTASTDHTARLWDARNGAPLGILYGHGEDVSEASFSTDGQRILTGSRDGTSRVWVNGRAPLSKTLQGHGDSVWTAEFSHDGRRIVTGSSDKIARIWDAMSGTPVTTFEAQRGRVSSARFDPAGQRVVIAAENQTIDTGVGGLKQTTGDSSTVSIYEISNAKVLTVLQGHQARVNTARFSPDGQHIVTASWDNTAAVWDAASGKRESVLRGHNAYVEDAQFSPDGQKIVTASWDKTARLWNVSNGTLLIVLKGHEDYLESAQFSADGRYVVTASDDNTARVWDCDNGTRVAIFRGHQGSVLDAEFSPSGRYIVTGSNDHTARIWDVANGRLLAILRGHDGAVAAAQFSPDEEHVVTASLDGTARIWTLIPRDAGPSPGWFRDFLHYMAQKELKRDGELESIPPNEWLILRERLRHVARDTSTAETPYLRVLRHFVHD